MRKKSKRASTLKPISAEEFDRMADEGDDITPYLDREKALYYPASVKRVNVDFPEWMVERLDQEALRLNISRQAVIKTWIRERLEPARPNA